MNTLTLQKVTLVIGFVFTLIGIAMNVMLYNSFADTMVDKGLYIALGFFFDTIKVFLLPLAALLWVWNKPISAFIAFTFWGVLTTISIAAGFGFMATVQDETGIARALSSDAYQAAKERATSSQRLLESLEEDAGVDIQTLDSQIQSLESRKQTLQANLADCPKGWKTNCIEPVSALIATVDKELAPLYAQISRKQAYDRAFATHDQAQKAAHALASGQVTADQTGLHAVFRYGETLLGVPAVKLRVYLLIISSVTCELLATFLIFMALSVLSPHRKTLIQVEDKSDEKQRVGFVDTSQLPVPATAKQAEKKEETPPKADPTALSRDPYGERNYSERDHGERNDHDEPSAAEIGVGGEIQCPVCQKLFTKRTFNHKFCGEDCRLAFHGITDKQAMLKAKTKKQVV